jgi:hypothetical protein
LRRGVFFGRTQICFSDAPVFSGDFSECLFQMDAPRNILIQNTPGHTRIFPAYPHFIVSLIPVFQFLLACFDFRMWGMHIILKFKHYEIKILQKQGRKTKPLGCIRRLS